MSNDFLSFAGDPAANVMLQSDYAGSSFLPTLLLGFQTGVAPSAQLNKVWRQSSLMTSMLGSFIDAHGMNAIDDGSPAGQTNLLNNFITALGQVVQAKFPDAPSDGSFYGRQNMTWQHVPAEAPSDGGTYARHNGAWTSIAGSSGIPDAPSDGNVYGRLNATWSIVGSGGGLTQGQADLRYLQLTGGTLTGTVGLLLSGAAATNRHVISETGTTWRWELRLANADPESTNNAGSNLAILRYSDGGALIDQPITINRATGVLDFAHPPTLSGQPIPGLTPAVPPIAVTTPGTSVFNDPGYGTIIIVDCYGAGGSGGPGTNVTGGAGGGGGAHTRAIFQRANLTFPITLTIGAGGAAVPGTPLTYSPGLPPNYGLVGGTTSFGNYLYAYGGGGGQYGDYEGGGSPSLKGGGPGGGGGGQSSPGNSLSGGPPQYITGYGGEPIAVTYDNNGLSNVGGGGGSSFQASSQSNGGAGSGEWGGGAGACLPYAVAQTQGGPINYAGWTGGASIYGGAGGGSGGQESFTGNSSGSLYISSAGGRGGQVNTYSSFQIGVPPGSNQGNQGVISVFSGPVGGAAGTNAGAGTAAHGNATFGGQGGPGGASNIGAVGNPASGITVTGFPGGRGGDCGGGGGGGGMGLNQSDGHGTGGTSGAGGNGAIFITIL